MSEVERERADINQLAVLFSQSPKLNELLRKSDKQKNAELIRLSRKLSALLVQLKLAVKQEGVIYEIDEIINKDPGHKVLSEIRQEYGWNITQVKSLFLALGQNSLAGSFDQLEVELSLSMLCTENGQAFHELRDSLRFYFDSDIKALDFLNKMIVSMTAKGLFKDGQDTERAQVFASLNFIINQLRRLKVIYARHEDKVKEVSGYYPESNECLALIGQEISKLIPVLPQQTIIDLYKMLVESK